MSVLRLHREARARPTRVSERLGPSGLKRCAPSAHAWRAHGPVSPARHSTALAKDGVVWARNASMSYPAPVLLAKTLRLNNSALALSPGQPVLVRQRAGERRVAVALHGGPPSGPAPVGGPRDVCQCRAVLSVRQRQIHRTCGSRRGCCWTTRFFAARRRARWRATTCSPS